MPTSLEVAKKHKPGSRTVTIRYGKIPARGGVRKAWGFDISDMSATSMWYGIYTCSRPSAKRIFTETLKPNAEERGFKVVLVVDENSGLADDLTRLTT